jgi:PAS domain S-box-containing protein
VLGLVGIGLYGLGWTLIVPQRVSRNLLLLPLALLLISVLMLVRARRIRTATVVFLIGNWFTVTLLVATAGGTRSPAFGLYFLGIMSAVLFSGWRAATAYGVATLGASGMMVYLAHAGTIAPPFATSASAWLTQTAIMIFIALEARIIFRDIQRSLHDRQRSEERFRLISSVTSDYTFSADVDPDGRLQTYFLTGAFETITGYSNEEFIARGGWASIVHPDDRAIDEQDLSRLKQNQRLTTELRIIRKDGSICWVRVNAMPVWGEKQDRLIGINGGVRDITERKQAEQAILDLNQQLANRASHLAALNEIARDVSAISDLDTTLRRVLHKLQTILPLGVFYVALYEPATDTISFPIMYDSGAFWDQPPGSMSKSEIVAGVIRTGQPLLINRTPEALEHTTNIKSRVGDSSRVSASIMMAPLRVADRVIGVISVQSYTLNSYDDSDLDLLTGAGYQIAIAVENARLYDSLQSELAERQRLEDELQAYTNQLETLVAERTNALRLAKDELELVLNNTTNALAFADPRGDVIVANPAFRNTFAHPNERAIESVLWALADEQQIRRLADALVNTMYGAQAQRVEVRVIEPGGSGADIEISLIPVGVVEPDRRSGVLLSGHDITQLKELERFKSRFVADAVHDLATPISGLSARLYLLKRDPSRLDEHVRALENQAQHLRNLLEDLQTLNLIDRGQIGVQKAHADLNQLVQRVFDTYEPVALNKKQSLIFSPDSALPLLAIDSRLIERVLVNLVSNAVNYTAENRQIRVETAAEDGFAVITVTDQGIGIRPDDLPHIFERFYRSSDARRTLATGTGLGLPIAREIVEMHGGTLGVSSVEGEGSTFVVRLPLSAD